MAHQSLLLDTKVTGYTHLEPYTVLPGGQAGEMTNCTNKSYIIGTTVQIKLINMMVNQQQIKITKNLHYYL